MASDDRDSAVSEPDGSRVAVRDFAHLVEMDVISLHVVGHPHSARVETDQASDGNKDLGHVN